MSLTCLLVVRHGEVVNPEKRLMGQMDFPLSQRGIQQAWALGRRLQTWNHTALYSSDLGRACETARHIAAHCDAKEIILNNRLRERNAGVLQGLTAEEMENRFPDVLRSQDRIGFSYVIPGGESDEQICLRAASFLDYIVQKHAGETVIAVTHSGIATRILQHVLGLSCDSRRRLKVPNASLSVFIHEDSHWNLQTWGDVEHLSMLSV